MVDIDLLVNSLRAKGHNVRAVHHVPDNAGDYELTIDDKAYNLEEARHLLELDDDRQPSKTGS